MDTWLFKLGCIVQGDVEFGAMISVAKRGTTPVSRGMAHITPIFGLSLEKNIEKFIMCILPLFSKIALNDLNLYVS
jgi:hypothetical protein